MQEMGSVRFALSSLALGVLVCGAIAACSAGDQPPPISDSDGSADKGDGNALPPCSSPAAGCPCAEAGAQYYCGVVYRKSGNYLDCYPGYLTCQDDGGWSSCVGPSIYDGN